ncbi:MAG: PDR/VanB family oxidoreductase [Acetobacteraceae bacterium]|nr:PDR/VanB family oxidoreductase [Acetobacteraceae bacterium]MDW8397067.1 PDR/VanB family oxidoreductase [Acetobacteraceae bacterium]
MNAALLADPASTTGYLPARLVAARLLAPDIRLLEFAPEGAAAFPPHEAGAHIDVLLTIGGRRAVRSYSLLGDGRDPSRYAIAVRLDPEGQGGSAAMHALAVGDLLPVSAPRCHFPIALGASAHRLIAGGIGITAILSLATALVEGRAPVSLHYAARTADRLVFRSALAALVPGARFFAGDRGERLDLARALSDPQPGEALYVCGPARMIEEARRLAPVIGWPEGALRTELFGTRDPAGDLPFTLRLARTGGEWTVPPGRSIADVLAEAGLDPLLDCRRGECGLCVAKVAELRGEIAHRDRFLSEAEKAAGDRLCTCVSRARGTLVLDL